MREKLINLILSYTQDGFEASDIIEMAKESEEQLLDRVGDILEYYVNEYHAS
jgi:hypothetical protein